MQFIKQAQDLGFSLEEIKGLMATGGAAECRKVRDLLHAPSYWMHQLWRVDPKNKFDGEVFAQEVKKLLR